MGIVIKQSSISTIFTYIGVAIGYLNVLWLFPSFLSLEQIGLFKIIPNIAFLMLPLAQLGLSQSLLKFYPELKNEEKGIAQLLGLLTLGILSGILVLGSTLWIFQNAISDYFISKSALLIDYSHVIVCLVIIFSFQILFEIYTRTLYKIIFLNFIKEVLTRLLTSVAVMLYFLEYISFSELVNGLIVIYSVVLISLLLYLKFLGKLKISFRFNLISKSLFKRIINYSLFALLGSGGSYILLNIDQVMITSMIGLAGNGIYTTAFYTAVVIEMVRRPISQITQPIISESFERNDIKAIAKIYQQVSINQMIIGGLLLVGILSNLDNLYQLMPNSEVFAVGKWIVILIGIGKLIDMTFGINGEIIVLSKYYKFNVVTIVVLAIMTIVLNYIFIPVYGINGAAFATLITIIIYNLVKMTFIYVKYQISPFTYKNLIMILIIGLSFFIGFYFPKMDNILLDILIRSFVITLFFGTMVVTLKVSEEVNSIVKKAFLVVTHF